MTASRRSAGFAGRAWLLALACVLLATPARGDGGTLRVSKRTRELELSVFTDPTPVHLGTVDVSILVQPRDGNTEQPLPGFQICAYPVGKPQKRQCVEATAAAALNKVFRAAQLELTEPGLWQVEIEVETSRNGGVTAQFELPVEDGYAPRESYGLWIGLPIVAVLVYFVHRRLTDRRRLAPTPPPGP